MKRGFIHRLKLLFIPVEDNSYRPRILRRQALLSILVAALLIEGAMVAQIIAHTSLKDLFAAVLPSSIEAFTNDKRSELELPPLFDNPILAAAALRKANDMASKGYFSHASPDGRQPWDFMKEAGYDFRYAGENLAVHFYDSSDVVSAWMASPSHKANIVKPVYTEIGVGVATGVYEGKQTTFVVQFFGTPKAKVAEAESPTSAVLAETALDEVVLSSEAAEPAVAGESIVADPTNGIARLLGSPRATALWILSGFLALLIVGLLLTFVIKVHIQPLDLLANGALVAAFVAGLIVLNDRFFTSSLQIG